MKTIEDALAHADEFDGPGSELRSVVMLAAEVRRLREENERLRENAKTISELEQLAARSNNELLVENERLRKDAEWMNGDIADLRQLIARYRERELTMGWNQE